jgi:hypothetical protein
LKPCSTPLAAKNSLECKSSAIAKAGRLQPQLRDFKLWRNGITDRLQLMLARISDAGEHMAWNAGPQQPGEKPRRLQLNATSKR